MHHTAQPSTAYSAAINRAPPADANSFIQSSAVATASSPRTFTHTHHGRGMEAGALASDIKEKSFLACRIVAMPGELHGAKKTGRGPQTPPRDNHRSIRSGSRLLVGFHHQHPQRHRRV